MRAFEIEWDLSDDVYEYDIDDCDIPTEVDIPDEVFADCVTDQDFVDEAVNYLSDEYGFLVIDFSLER